MSNDYTVKQEIVALRDIALGNALLIVSWVAAAVAGMAIGRAGLAGVILGFWGVVILGVTSWPIGLLYISAPPIGLALSRLGYVLRRSCQLAAAMSFALATLVTLSIFGMVGSSWENPLFITTGLASLLTPLYAWYAGILGWKLKSPLAWLFWLWMPVSLVATWLCVVPEGSLPHWVWAVAVVADRRVWLGDLMIVGFVLPVLIAHISLQWTLRETIRRLRTDSKSQPHVPC